MYIRASDAFLLQVFETAKNGTSEHEIYYSNMVGHEYKVGQSMENYFVKNQTKNKIYLRA